jgi:hypothetical protein
MEHAVLTMRPERRNGDDVIILWDIAQRVATVIHVTEQPITFKHVTSS